MNIIVSPRGIALVLGVTISGMTVAFLSLVDEVSQTALFVAFLLAFSSSYLLTYLVLEFLVFREMNHIYEILEEKDEKEFKLSQRFNSHSFSPFKQFSSEIYSYAEDKEKEIKELKKMAAFRREFIADVSHELKTPIFAAQGFVHTLLDGAVNDKSVRKKFLKKAAKSLDSLDLLVQDLLALSQIETGDIKLHYEYIDLVKLTEDVFEQFENRAVKKDVKLIFSDRINTNNNIRQQAYAFADYKLISQVMSNLISNAIKYSRENETVEVDFVPDQKEVTVFVKDTGLGIPPSDVGHIFQRFYRVEKSRTKDKEKGGTGLGLAIVKHIIEAHGSKVNVTSKVGKGSVFSFKLSKEDNQPTPSSTL